MLVDKLLLFASQIVFEGDVLRIRKLLVVVEKIFSAKGSYPIWMCLHTEAPTSNVYVMHAIVASIAAAKPREPAPRGVQEISLIGNHGRGTDPQIVVEMRRR